MTNHRWWLYLFIGSGIILSGFNLVWLKFPKSVPLAVLVCVNLLGGVAFLLSLFGMALWSVRLGLPVGAKITVRPLFSLACSLLIANVVALYICNFHFCFLIVLLNLAVPVGWHLGRQAMLRRVVRG
jgi:hypothetical protein